MAGYDNIKDYGFDKRSGDEVREIQARGGRNSGKTRRAKKTMRETAKTLLSMDVVGEKTKKT